MVSSARPSGSGPSFLSLLGLLFIGLKLGGVIDWPWWQVTLPLWGGWALVFGVALFGTVVLVVADMTPRHRRRRKRKR